MVDEGITDSTYTVALNTPPTADVTVTITSDNPDVTTSPINLTFTALDWNSPKTVTIMAAEDANIVEDTANLRHTASGGNYDDSAASTLTVTVRDNDAPLTFDTSTIPLPSTSTFTFTVGQEVSLMLPGAIGGMPPLTYSLRPLPSGLTLDADASPPTITGMSNAVFDPASLTYTVTDSAPSRQPPPR